MKQQPCILYIGSTGYQATHVCNSSVYEASSKSYQAEDVQYVEVQSIMPQPYTSVVQAKQQTQILYSTYIAIAITGF